MRPHRLLRPYGLRSSLVGLCLLVLGLGPVHARVSIVRPDSALAAAVGLRTTLVGPADGHVTASGGKFLVDGTPVHLRGMNITPGTLTPSDLDLMASWSVNLIRYRFHWSRLETTAPVKQGPSWVHSYNTSYIDTMNQEIGLARQRGIYVLIDNHPCASEDEVQCSYFGYPSWLYKSNYNSKGITYPETPDGQLQAQTDLWSDALRQQFTTDMLKYVAQQLQGVQGIAGYEILNEPQPGSLPATSETTGLMLDTQLAWAQAIRAVDPDHMIVFASRFGWGAGIINADFGPWEALGNVAFDVHDYFGGRWGSGTNLNPDSPDYGESTGILFNHVGDVVQDGGPYIGSTLGHVRFLQLRGDALGQFGIPLLVGELGADPTDPGIYNFYGSATSAFNYVGVAWTAKFIGRLGILNGDRSQRPWAYIVIQALQNG
jgi:hypothetical protein